MPDERDFPGRPVPELYIPAEGAPPAAPDPLPAPLPDGEGLHFALRSRDRGPCGRMTGDVMVLMVYVSTPKYPWNEKKEKEVVAKCWRSLWFLEKQAARYHAPLKFSIGCFETSIPMELADTKNYMEWYRYILKNFFSSSNMPELQTYYEQKLNKTDTPVVFLFTNEDRSCAVNSSTNYPNWQEEFCMLFFDGDFRDLELAHELCHQYGAVDLYDYKEEGIAAATRRIFPHSVMLTVTDPLNEVDPLTAYLMGWTDTVSPAAKKLLAEIRDKR